MKLHPIKSNRTDDIYCGPAAVSSITGKSIECAEAWINYYRTHRLDKIVRGSWPYEVAAALHELGYQCSVIERYSEGDKPPTLAKWLRERKDRNATYIINTTGHYVTVKGNKLIDNHTEEPVFIRKAPHRRARVWKVIEVTESDSENAAKIRRKRKDVLPTDPLKRKDSLLGRHLLRHFQ